MSLAAGPTGQNVLRLLAGHLRILLHRTDQHNRLGFKFFPAHIPVMVRGFARMKEGSGQKTPETDYVFAYVTELLGRYPVGPGDNGEAVHGTEQTSAAYKYPP